MATFEDLRRCALALPQAYEDTHFEGPAFRVKGRKFALLWQPTRQTILKLPPDLQARLFRERPQLFTPLRVGTVDWSSVVLQPLGVKELGEWVTQAWSTVAGKREVRAWQERGEGHAPRRGESPLLD